MLDGSTHHIYILSSTVKYCSGGCLSPSLLADDVPGDRVGCLPTIILISPWDLASLRTGHSMQARYIGENEGKRDQREILGLLRLSLCMYGNSFLKCPIFVEYQGYGRFSPANLQKDGTLF